MLKQNFGNKVVHKRKFIALHASIRKMKNSKAKKMFKAIVEEKESNMKMTRQKF